MLRLLLLTALLLTAPTGALAGRIIRGVPQVTDGDSLRIDGVRVRLHGIDAPESGQRCLDAEGAAWRCGRAATRALRARIDGGSVRCRRVGADSYGRTVARCSLRGRDLNAWMVKQGWAVAYRRYSTRYVRHERRARRASRGVWAGPMVMPWQWRAGERIEPSKQASTAPEGCPIKGNINRSGERIYHLPGTHAYPKVRIDTDRGERWFCTAAEARAAGWRAVRR